MKVTIETATEEGFFRRAKAIGKKLDEGTRLKPEMRITFEDPTAMMRVLTSKRVELIHAIRQKPAGVSELAAMLRRDRAAVDRDVKVLQELGLVTTRIEVNPGHGRRKVVRPLAAKYQLSATI